MPELPEVEIVSRGLAQTIARRRVSDVVVRVPALRWPMPSALPVLLAGRTVVGVGRRGKYVLLEFENGWLIVHLGMSGSLCLLPVQQPVRVHDHLDLVFDDQVLRLNDPRRFGAVLWHPRESGSPYRHPQLAALGVEPFDDAFDGALLHGATRRRRAPIKQVLLAGDIVVGVGNIYASESLFRARIRPTTLACRIGAARYDALAVAIRETLGDAIAAGGSTLRDFVSSSGHAGCFQLQCFVYDREAQPCRICGTKVRLIRQQQRSTFYCPSCQR